MHYLIIQKWWVRSINQYYWWGRFPPLSDTCNMDTRIHMFKSTMHQLYEFIFQNYKKRLGGDATWGLILEPGKSPRKCGKLTVSIVFLVDGRTRECFFSQATRRVLEEHIFATEELQTITWKTHITY